MKQIIIKYSSLILFLLISLYYTNQVIIELRNKDPIMIQIKKQKEKYETRPVNAIIEDNTIIPGQTGIEVDIEKSYHQMKRYGSYNESLTVLKEVKPTISIQNNYNNYIERGNKNKRVIYLVFLINNKNNPKDIIPILEKEQIPVTFFIDGNVLEKYTNLIKEYKIHEYEIESFNSQYNPSYLQTSRSYLESITNNNTKFCYTEIDNIDLLKNCSKNNYHTIKAIHIYKDNLFYNIKQDLENSSIYSIRVNQKNLEELSLTIKYIKSKGFLFAKIEDLLEE